MDCSTQPVNKAKTPLSAVQKMKISSAASSIYTPGNDFTPADGMTPSHSATSMSSAGSVDPAINLKEVNEKIESRNGIMLDTYGNKFVLPDFTISEIRKAIPSECFERPWKWSVFYTLRDIAQFIAVFAIFFTYVTPKNVPSGVLRGMLWFAYTMINGWIGTGIWVIAHECGHQAFSTYKILNDTVGFILHSALGVPYFSWKISHGKHHKATGHLERDMVFVPQTRDQFASKLGKFAHELSELTEETPIFTALSLIGQQLAGWNMYLAANTTGHNFHARAGPRGEGKMNGVGGKVNHFDPASPLYEEKDAYLILLSDVGLLAMVAILTLLGMRFGFANIFVWYIAPYLWVNNWLVWITYLQHTDPTLPHYDAKTWTYTRGAAATIDRDFGFIGKYFMHGIVETHVLHHYVSQIPWYNADKASAAIKPIMGRHYRADVKGGLFGFIKAIWTASRYCQFVEPSEGADAEGKGVYFFRNHNGNGIPMAKLAPPPSSEMEGATSKAVPNKS